MQKGLHGLFMNLQINHNTVSYLKSLIRIAAASVLCGGHFVAAGVLLVIAEVLGIAEELV